jgi:catechol 2,3-dioxygenase-like lactoylglutathione lyase family enzyme
MALFWTDSIALCYSNVEAAKRWWIETLGCKQVKLPANWDDPLPSDVALMLPGDTDPTIALSDQAEVQRAGLERPNDRVIIFCSKRKLEKAHEHLRNRGASPGPIQDGGGTQFFEIRDPEGNVIEICGEP